MLGYVILSTFTVSSHAANSSNPGDKTDKKPENIGQLLLDKLDFVGLVGVIVTIAIFWYTQSHESKDRLSRAFATTSKELENHIYSEKKPHITRKLSDSSAKFYGISKIDFINAYFNTHAFFSLVYSGLLTYLDKQVLNKEQQQQSHQKGHK